MICLCGLIPTEKQIVLFLNILSTRIEEVKYMERVRENAIHLHPGMCCLGIDTVRLSPTPACFWLCCSVYIFVIHLYTILNIERKVSIFDGNNVLAMGTRKIDDIEGDMRFVNYLQSTTNFYQNKIQGESYCHASTSRSIQKLTTILVVQCLNPKFLQL